VVAEREGTGAEGAAKAVTDAGFEIVGTPYADVIRRFFER